MSNEARASIDQYSDWPAGSGTTILTSESNGTDPLEPSGLTIYTDGNRVQWIYLVSDNGRIARRRVDLSDDWLIQSFFDASHKKQSDYESICMASGLMMVGVEGGDKDGDPSHAQIKIFTPDTTSTKDSDSPSVGSFAGSAWNLQDVNLDVNSGMEALTFVPDGYYPSSWLPASQNGRALFYGGVFLAGFQSKPGTIYVYDLPEGNGQMQDVSAVFSFTTDLLSSRRLSDLFYNFPTETLYALYDDDANTQDALQELKLNANGISLLYQTKPPYYGCEAIAINVSTLYLGIDQSSAQWSKNGGSGKVIINYVYQFDRYTAHSS